VAASSYFDVMDDMVRSDDPFWRFDVRSRRPAENAINAALLSFTYALLRNDTVSALSAVGFDPAVGYMHALRPGRPALALDMMEELRSPLCDRFVLTLINRKQLNKQDFSNHTSEFLLSDKARKTVLTEWQTRKQEKIEHPFLHEQISIGLIPFVQANLLAHTFRGDIDCYPPFHWR
jgi:CRISPR-associated protein Cas1